MSDAPIHRRAPVPVGDVVPGDPPVPVTVWFVPPPHAGETVSMPLGYRLVHDLTYDGELVVDLTVGPQLARAVMAAGRRFQQPRGRLPGREPAAMVVAGRPSTDLDLTQLTAGAASRLRPGGSLAVVHPHNQTVLAETVAAGRAAGLTYLQHIVASTQPAGASNRPPIHSDVIILRRPDTPTDPTIDEEDHHV